MAMKTLGNGGVLGGSQGGIKGDPIGTYPAVVTDLMSVREAHSFALSLPVSAIVSGFNSLGQLRENIGTAERFKPLTEVDRKALVSKCAALGRSGVMEHYKRYNA